MLDGGGDVTGMKGFLGALEFFEGFGGDADLADGDRVGGMGRRGSGIGFETGANGRERIGGIEGAKAGVGCARLRSGISPGLSVKIEKSGSLFRRCRSARFMGRDGESCGFVWELASNCL